MFAAPAYYHVSVSVVWIVISLSIVVPSVVVSSSTVYSEKTTSTKKLLWSTRCQEGLQYQEQQRYTEAEMVWKEQLANYDDGDTNPNSLSTSCPYIHTLYGILLLTTQRIDQSIVTLERAYHYDPYDYIALGYLGICHEYLLRKYVAHRSKLRIRTEQHSPPLSVDQHEPMKVASSSSSSSSSSDPSSSSSYNQGYQYLLREIIRYLQLALTTMVSLSVPKKEKNKPSVLLPHQSFALSLRTIYRTLGTSLQWYNNYDSNRHHSNNNNNYYYQSIHLYLDNLYRNKHTTQQELGWINYWSRPTDWYSYHYRPYHSIGIQYYHTLLEGSILERSYDIPYVGYSDCLTLSALEKQLTGKYPYRPFYFRTDTGFTPLLTKLENIIPTIRQEFWILYKQFRRATLSSSSSDTKEISSHTPVNTNISSLFKQEEAGLQDSHSWDIYSLVINGQLQAVTCVYTPTTCQLLQKDVPEIFIKRGQVKFSILQKGTYIKPHVGPTNNRLRVHCSIVLLATDDHQNNSSSGTSTDAWIRVGPFFYTWKDNECFIFDESYEHEVGIHLSNAQNKNVEERCDRKTNKGSVCHYERITTTDNNRFRDNDQGVPLKTEKVVMNSVGKTSDDNSDGGDVPLHDKETRIILILDIANPFVNFPQFSTEIFTPSTWNKNSSYLQEWWEHINDSEV